MLIKYRGNKKFIFIANRKCASSSIEASQIGKIADLKITRTPIGKHMTIDEVYERFDWIFAEDEFNFHKFLKFGIIRDPLARVISWYNFRSRPELKNNPNKYTANLSFGEFWHFNKNSDFLEPQYKMFFSSKNDNVKVDYLCRQENLEEDLLKIKEILSLNSFKLPQSNTSQKRIGVKDIKEDLKNSIKQFYAHDYELINNLDAINSKALSLFSQSKISEHENSKNVLLPRFSRIYRRLKNFIS